MRGDGGFSWSWCAAALHSANREKKNESYEKREEKQTCVSSVSHRGIREGRSLCR